MKSTKHMGKGTSRNQSYRDNALQQQSSQAISKG